MKNIGLWIFLSVVVICLTIMTVMGQGETAALVAMVIGTCGVLIAMVVD